nr:aminoglycoside phosphotransferase family protein [Rhizobium sp. CG5]
MVRPPVDRWGVTAELLPLVGGHRNLAFKTLGLPRELVFKTTRRTTAAILWLVQVQQIARQHGFVVPELIESRWGQLVEDGWTCETHVEGTSFAPEEMPAILPLISDFHAATADLPQRPGFLSSVALLDEVSGGDVDLDTMPVQLVSRCREAWRGVQDRKDAIIHGDLNPGNLIRCSDGRTALIDWDECRRDLVLFDLGTLREGDEAERKARLAWEVACSWLVEPDHAKEIAAQL